MNNGKLYDKLKKAKDYKSLKDNNACSGKNGRT